MLGALAALVNSLIWGLRAPWDKRVGALFTLIYFLYIAGQSLYYRLFGQYIFLSSDGSAQSHAKSKHGPQRLCCRRTGGFLIALVLIFFLTRLNRRETGRIRNYG